jgi:hypothetical protein
VNQNYGGPPPDVAFRWRADLGAWEPTGILPPGTFTPDGRYQWTGTAWRAGPGLPVGGQREKAKIWPVVLLTMVILCFLFTGWWLISAPLLLAILLAALVMAISGLRGNNGQRVTGGQIFTGILTGLAGCGLLVGLGFVLLFVAFATSGWGSIGGKG